MCTQSLIRRGHYIYIQAQLYEVWFNIFGCYIVTKYVYTITAAVRGEFFLVTSLSASKHSHYCTNFTVDPVSPLFARVERLELLFPHNFLKLYTMGYSNCTSFSSLLIRKSNKIHLCIYIVRCLFLIANKITYIL